MRLCALVCCLLLWSLSAHTADNNRPPPGEPIDYFPMKVGTSWTYTIAFSGKRVPLSYEEIAWPVGNETVNLVTRRGYMGFARTSELSKTHTLSFRVKRVTLKQGRFSFPMGVELEVVEDTIPYFAHSKQIFLKASQHPGQEFMGYLLILYEAGSTPGSHHGVGPWGTWGAEPGYQDRLLFFGSKPKVSIGVRRGGREPQEELLFQGVERVPGLNVEGLRFTRTVKSSPKDGIVEKLHPFDLAFSEDMWFVRGQGLARLVQTVEGEVTMIWTLTKFTQ